MCLTRRAPASETLWEQRSAVELLLFKLTQTQLVLANGHLRSLPQADAELRPALERLHRGELGRAASAAKLANEYRLHTEATLSQLAAAAPQHWATMLQDHHRALRDLVGQLRAVAEENTELIDACSRSAARRRRQHGHRRRRHECSTAAARPAAPPR